MNWKFWTWPRQIRLAEGMVEIHDRMAADYRKLWEEACESGREADKKVVALCALLDMKERMAKSTPSESQILSALVLVDETTPLWRALHRMLDETEAAELDDAVRPGQPNEHRQYHAGRVAMLEDLRVSLLNRWAEARRQNHAAQQP